LPPDEQRGRARAARAQDLRGDVGLPRGQRQLQRDRLGILGERAADVVGALAPVGAVVGQQRDLQLLRDQVLRVAEGDPVVRRRDPEDVRPRGRVHEAGAAVVHDADGDAVAPGELPGRVDPGPVRHDRDRVGVERPPRVLHGLAGGEVVVVERDAKQIALVPDADAAAGVEARGRELDPLADRLRDVRAARDRHVDGNHEAPAFVPRA
jgi:hypothetical protein